MPQKLIVNHHFSDGNFEVYPTFRQIHICPVMIQHQDGSYSLSVLSLSEKHSSKQRLSCNLSSMMQHLLIRHPATRVFGREPSFSMDSPNSISTKLEEFPKNLSMIIGPSIFTWDGNPNQLLVSLNLLVSRQLWLLQSSCFLVTANPKRIVVFQPQFGGVYDVGGTVKPHVRKIWPQLIPLLPGWWLNTPAKWMFATRIRKNTK